VRPRARALLVALCVYFVTLTLTDGDSGGRERPFLSPQFGRHSAPSRIGRSSHLPPPSDVIPPPSGRQSNTGGEIPPTAVSPVAGRRASAPRPDLRLPRRTHHKAKPAIVSPADRSQLDSRSSHVGHPVTTGRPQEDESPEDGLIVHDFPGHVSDNRCR